ncbi:uncharacterized protein LOC127122955 [Lathyrus oleraceus]|uniref:uncharacterized protein LOC127122955 n=1 Tax=Pisum sativum TaxID=3888 RepID=UPI0021D05CCB|nr:uncharacterized protein LOC127122955 [Pisum sativum]
MSDGWTDRKGRTLINFLVNCPTGTTFVKNVDASDYGKTRDKLVELLDTFIEEMGEQNIVQLITDNGSNYVVASKILTSKRPNMFWTPCEAHCIDLMLEDIGKIPKVDKVIKNGVKVMGYIYNHTFALNLMRKITGNVELVKNGVTRFVTSFLILQRLQELESKLREMFTCDEWVSFKCAKDAKGKRATSIILMVSFFSDVVYTLKIMAPLVDVLKMVDNERKPGMGYIYVAMGVVKESIEKAFNSNSKIENDPKLVRGLRKCIETLSESDEVEDKISVQLAQYKVATSLFGIRAAIKQRLTLAPVLSLGCNASNYRNKWD